MERTPSGWLPGLAVVAALLTLLPAAACGGSATRAGAPGAPVTTTTTAITTTSSTTTPSTTTTTIQLTATKVLVVGDSLGALLAAALDRLPADRRPIVTSRAALGCGILPGVPIRYGVAEHTTDGCDRWPQRWAEELDAVDPDVVVVVDGFWDAYDWYIDGVRTDFGTPAWDAFAAEQFGAAMDLLGSRGARVVWLQAPYFRPDVFEPRVAAYVAAHGEYRSAFDDDRVRHLNELFRTVASSRQCVLVPDARQCLCPEDEFVDVIDGVVVRGDGVHLTLEGGDLLAEWLLPWLRAAAPSCAR